MDEGFGGFKSADKALNTAGGQSAILRNFLSGYGIVIADPKKAVLDPKIKKEIIVTMKVVYLYIIQILLTVHPISTLTELGRHGIQSSCRIKLLIRCFLVKTKLRKLV